MEQQEFATWLNEQMLERGWSQSEMARQSQGIIDSRTISAVMRGDSRPGPRLCQGIAKALGLPVEEVMAHAGILPKSGKIMPRVKALNERIAALPTDEQRNAAIRALEQMMTAIEAAARLTLVF